MDKRTWMRYLAASDDNFAKELNKVKKCTFNN